jgi:transcriptional regulator with XRE-family HTH domain
MVSASNGSTVPSIAAALAKNLARLRSERGLSQEELAAKVGVHRNTIHRYESGDGGATLAALAKLAEVLRVEETDLVSAEPAPPRDHAIHECLRRLADAAGITPVLPRLSEETWTALEQAGAPAEVIDEFRRFLNQPKDPKGKKVRNR